MVGRLIEVAKSAYQYPLLFKQLWHTPLLHAADQEIVYRDLKRFTYRQIEERIARLASALDRIGVRPGETVGVLDWDSNRFLEAFFAIPMMGAVLQTANVRLSPEQVAYTINHAGASTLLVNVEFVGLLEGINPQLPKVKTLVVMSDRPSPQTGSLSFVGEYEDLLAAASPDYSGYVAKNLSDKVKHFFTINKFQSFVEMDTKASIYSRKGFRNDAKTMVCDIP